MDIETFIKRVEEEFEGVPKGSLTADGNFRDQFEWNSMNTLVLMALISTEFDTNITADELRGCNTLNDIYAIINTKKAS